MNNQGDSLKHYGTLGMKWGRRKARSGSSSKKTSTKGSESKSDKAKSGERRMTNKELKSRVNRAKLEADLMKNKADFMKNKYELATYESKLQPQTKSKIDKIISAGNKTVELGKTAKGVYDLLNDFGVFDQGSKKK